ncbi:MAG TPA: c-type cytochrome [Phenylobacterium sp.]|nr:c-type cytochrome [Phenylobacterium sp.]
MTPSRYASVVFVAALMTCWSAARDAEAAPSAPGAAPPGAAPLPGDNRRGAALYESRCSACHSLDASRIGPSHRGVFGRRAGAVPGFAYTPALARSGLTWTAANLDRWLTAPTSLVKGTAMGFRLSAPQDRADVIAYLASPAVTPRPPSTARRR